MAKPVQINFVFANYEKRLVVQTTTAATGADVKTLLLQNWPETVPRCEDRSRIRLICMGSGFLTDDAPLGKQTVMQAGPMSRQRFTHTHPTRSSFLARSPVPHIRPPDAHQRVDPSAPQCPATVAENRRPAATRPLRRQRQHAADACTSTATDADADADADAAVRANLASGAGAGGGDWAGARLRARGARAPPHRRGHQPRYRRRREGLHGAHAVVGHRAVVRPGLHHFLDRHVMGDERRVAPPPTPTTLHGSRL
jgi:hypothetical protein